MSDEENDMSDDHDNEEHSKDHAHDHSAVGSSKLRTSLVIASGALTGVGLMWQWLVGASGRPLVRRVGGDVSAMWRWLACMPSRAIAPQDAPVVETVRSRQGVGQLGQSRS